MQDPRVPGGTPYNDPGASFSGGYMPPPQAFIRRSPSLGNTAMSDVQYTPVEAVLSPKSSALLQKLQFVAQSQPSQSMQQQSYQPSMQGAEFASSSPHAMAFLNPPAASPKHSAPLSPLSVPFIPGAQQAQGIPTSPGMIELRPQQKAIAMALTMATEQRQRQQAPAMQQSQQPQTMYNKQPIQAVPVPQNSAAASQQYTIPWPKRPDCMFFIRASCSKGEECVFRHSEYAKNGTQETCPIWERDKACENPACRFLHPKQQPALRVEIPDPHAGKITPPLSPTTVTPITPSGVIPFAKKPDCMFFIRGPCTKGDKCVFRHNEKAKYGSQEVCPNWERLGKCEDLTCVHLHPKSVVSASPRLPITPQVPASPATSTTAPVHLIPWSKRPDCMFFIRSSCHKGEKCAFRHNEKAKMGSQELCPQWDQLGICEDRSCNLLHPKKPTSTSSTAATPTACAITSDIIGADVSSPPLSPTHFVTTIKDIVIPGKPQLSTNAPVPAKLIDQQPIEDQMTQDLLEAVENLLESCPGHSLRSTKIALHTKTRLPILAQTLKKYSSHFLLSDTVPPHVWLLGTQQPDEIIALLDLYTLLKQTPGRCMNVPAVGSIIQLPVNIKLLDLIRAHPELFSVSDTPPYIVHLEGELDGDYDPVTGDCAELVLQAEAEDHSEQITHVLEIYNFLPNKVRTRHLEKFLQPYLDSLSVRIKWVDDAHALAIFCTSDLAKQAMQAVPPELGQDSIKLRPFAEACPASKALSLKEEWGKPVKAPTIQPPGGPVGRFPISVTILCETVGSSIFYTTNGVTPTLSSTVYSNPIVIDKPVFLMARSFKNGMTDSTVTTAKFVEQEINHETSLDALQPEKDSAIANTREMPQSPVGAPPLVISRLPNSAPAPILIPPSGSPSPPLFSEIAESASQLTPVQDLPKAEPKKKPTLTITIPLSPQQFWVVPHKEITIDEAVPSTSIGGYGVVYYAKLRGNQVSVRQLDLLAEDSNVFQAEMAQLCTLRHANVARFYGVCMPPDPFCVISEFLGGITLHTLFNNPEVNLSKRDRTNYALGIARGMNYLHSCNVLHLDLTPKAVLVDHGTCKVAEYGLGKLATKLCLVPTSPTGATPAYMAPEVLGGKAVITPKADVYSFGIVLWQLVTGKTPFQGSSVPQIVALTVGRGKRPKIPPTCPYGYAKLIVACWSHDPSTRPSFDRIVTRLERVVKAV